MKRRGIRKWPENSDVQYATRNTQTGTTEVHWVSAKSVYQIVPQIEALASRMPQKHLNMQTELQSHAGKLKEAKHNSKVRDILQSVVRAITKFLKEDLSDRVRTALEALRTVLRDFAKDYVPECKLVPEFQV